MTGFDLISLAQATGGELLGEDRGFTHVSTDTRSLQSGALFVALEGPNFDGHDYVAQAAGLGAAGALVARRQAVDLPQVMVADTRRALGDFARAWRDRFDIPLVGVTGSNGKTTVKQLIAAILERRGSTHATRGNLNNEIGVPLTLLELRETHAAAVIEMGANHPGEIRYLAGVARPNIGIVTNAAPAHLEGFGDLDGVARAKGELFQSLLDGGTAVINADDSYADLWRGFAAPRRVLSFGLHATADFTAEPGSLKMMRDDTRFTMRTPDGPVAIELPLPGEHNVQNALGAAAAAWAAGAHRDDIGAGLATARGAGGRLQVKQGRQGVCVVDDTYNANPASLAAALRWTQALNMPVWLVLGDMRELGPRAALLHAEAGRQAREQGVQRLFALGDLSRHAAEAFGKGAEHYLEAAPLIESLTAELGAGLVVLVKGSRGMRMERVVAALLNGAEEGG